MRFMMLLRSDADTEAGRLPGESDIVAMDDYNREMREAGVLRSVEGLRSSADGTRVRLADGGSTRGVTEGPFIETKELIAGFWLIEVGSMEEAIEWAERCPCPPGAEVEIEIRTVFEPEDFEAVYLEQLSGSA